MLIINFLSPYIGKARTILWASKRIVSGKILGKIIKSFFVYFQFKTVCEYWSKRHFC
jgi:hypothetical protein